MVPLRGRDGLALPLQALPGLRHGLAQRRRESINPQGREAVSKGTPHRVVRISDEVWAAVQAKAAEEGATASEVVRRLLVEWLAE